MITLLALTTLRRHPARTALAIAGVTVAAALLLDMVYAHRRYASQLPPLSPRAGLRPPHLPEGHASDGYGGDDWRGRGDPSHPPGQSHIATATPVLGAQIHILGSRPITSFAAGIDPATEADYQVDMGANASAPDHIVVNAAFLAATGAQLGDTLDVVAGFDPALRTYPGRRRLVVAGRGRFFYTASDLRVAAVPIATLQAMGGPDRADRASLFLAKVRDSSALTRWPRGSIERFLASRPSRVRPRSLRSTSAWAISASSRSFSAQLASALGSSWSPRW